MHYTSWCPSYYKCNTVSKWRTTNPNAGIWILYANKKVCVEPYEHLVLNFSTCPACCFVYSNQLDYSFKIIEFRFVDYMVCYEVFKRFSTFSRAKAATYPYPIAEIPQRRCVSSINAWASGKPTAPLPAAFWPSLEAGKPSLSPLWLKPRALSPKGFKANSWTSSPSWNNNLLGS